MVITTKTVILTNLIIATHRCNINPFTVVSTTHFVGYNNHHGCINFYFLLCTHRKSIAKHMINHRISADWSRTKPIAAFSCTPRVQEVHTKAEVVHLTPGLLGLGVLFNFHA